MTVADEVGFALENRGIEASVVKRRLRKFLHARDWMGWKKEVFMHFRVDKDSGLP